MTLFADRSTAGWEQCSGLTFRSQSFRAQYLQCGDMDAETIRYLLIGPTLKQRAESNDAIEQWRTCIDAHTFALLRFVDKVYGRVSLAQTRRVLHELREVFDSSNVDTVSYMIKRAFIVYAAHYEPALTRSSPHPTPCVPQGEADACEPIGADATVEDVTQRVLPLLVPSFVDMLCQNPDRLLLMTSVLWLMWPEENILWQTDAMLADCDDGMWSDTDEPVQTAADHTKAPHEFPHLGTHYVDDGSELDTSVMNMGSQRDSMDSHDEYEEGSASCYDSDSDGHGAELYPHDTLGL